uniref:hypothetical protein n=1 Tax=Streptomyces griseus TaxID=1911 RepID=UPI001F401206
ALRRAHRPQTRHYETANEEVNDPTTPPHRLKIKLADDLPTECLIDGPDPRVKDVNELVRTVFRGGYTDLTCSRRPPVLKEDLDGTITATPCGLGR